jgi:hypothetical protein
MPKAALGGDKFGITKGINGNWGKLLKDNDKPKGGHQSEWVEKGQ